MENPNTGIIKKAPIGFSWTTLFFGPLPALFRGDISWFFIQLLLDWLFYIPGLLVFPFIYNKIHVKKCLEKGYKVKDVEGVTLDEAKKRLGINLPQFQPQTQGATT